MTTDWKRWICLTWLLLIPLSGNAATPTIAAGYSTSSVFLNSDGSVWGTGSVYPYWPGATSPVRLLQLPGVTTVAASGNTDFALLADGILWGSGGNTFGVLGDGTTQNRSQPQRVPGLSGINALAVSAHVLAVKQDGTVWAWGRNDQGQLGDGTRTDRYLPAPVIGLTNITRVSASATGSLALKADGTVWVWGATGGGRAGNGLLPANDDADPEAHHLVPTQVHNLDQVVAIAAGDSPHMALRADGTVWTWGGGARMENGAVVFINQVLPVQMPGLDHVVAIEIGQGYSLALKADGTLWAWGNNNLGQLGVSGITYSAIPIQVPGVSDVTAIAAGQSHVVALRRDGTVLAWGWNNNGQLGDNTLQDRAQPGPVAGPGGTGQLNLLQPAPTSFNQLPSAQISLSVSSGRAPLTVQATVINATDPDGTITSYFWNSSDGRQATGSSITLVFAQAGTYDIDLLVEDNAGGRGSARRQIVVIPTAVTVSANPKAAMNRFNGVALANDGRILAWGQKGGLGLYDPQAQYSLPDLNTLPIANGTSGAVDFALGAFHIHVLLVDGTVFGWGSNSSGEVGSGSRAAIVNQPQFLSNLPPVQALAAGYGHSLALTRDGRVFAWGSNVFSELGLGDNINRFQPTEVTGLGNVIAIAAGYHISIALKADGSVWAWGDNGGFSLGDGTSISRNRPIQIPGLVNVTKIFATKYNYSVFAQKADGTVWVTGILTTLVSGDPGPNSGARRVPLFDGFVQITGGGQHVIALKADGTVWTGGQQGSFALGFPDSGDVPGLRQLPGISDAIGVAAGSNGSIILRRDGTILSWGLNNYGQIGDGTLAPQQTPVLVVNETANGFLDLIPEVANTIPQNLIPPFFLATYSSGSLSSISLYADLRGITAGGTFASADNLGNALVGALAAGGYNVYVAAAVPHSGAFLYFQLDSSNVWSALTWPMVDFLRGVALGSQDALIRVNILQNVDVSPYIGTSILVGYGTDPDEMVSNGRYRTIFTVTQQ